MLTGEKRGKLMLNFDELPDGNYDSPVRVRDDDESVSDESAEAAELSRAR